MPELLSQEEVNALLQSVPLVEETLHRPDPPGARARPGSRPRAVRYDFRRASHVSPSALQNLHFVHERYARTLSLDLSGYLRTTSDVALLTVEPMTYADFLMSLPETTCVNVVRADPRGGRFALEVNPTLAFAVIEKLMGGASESPTMNREITAIEQHLLAGFIEMSLRDLQDAWKPFLGSRLSLERQETSPQLVQIVAPDEPVVLVAFEVTVGQSSGMMNLCLPSLYLGDLATAPSAEPVAAPAAPPTPEQALRIEDVVGSAAARLTAHLSVRRLPVRELLALEAGDVLPLHREADAPVSVSVAGLPKFQAGLGVRGERRAVRILAAVASPSGTKTAAAGSFRSLRPPRGGNAGEGGTP